MSNASLGPREPFLSKTEGASEIVKFNADWAKKCASDDTFAAFVPLFDENRMPTIRPIVLNEEDMEQMPEALQASLITHASKKFVDATATRMELTEKLYNKYWMSLSVDWQQRLIGAEGYQAIKDNYNVRALKNLLETLFANPVHGAVATRTAIENAWNAYQNSQQYEKETLAMYYKRFIQIVTHMATVITEEQRRPTVDMQVTRFLSSLNRRDSVFYAKLKERAALTGNPDEGFPISLEDALAKGANFLLQHYGGGKHIHASTNPLPAVTVYSAAAQKTGKKAAKDAESSAKATSNSAKGGKADLSHIICFGCGQPGHYRSNCPAKEVNSLTVCGSCDILPPEEFEVGAADADSENTFACFSAEAVVRVKSDTCAQVCVVGEGFPIENLRNCPPLIIKGVGGNFVVSMVGSFGPLNRIYYHPEFPVNILAFGDIERVADVEYIQNEGFIVRFRGIDGEFFFAKDSDNTFSCDFPMSNVLSTTVAEKEKMYSKAEVERARGVRELKRNLGGASDKELNEFIANGVALNCPFTPEDVRRASIIYGPDIACLKGKMTSPGPERPLVVNVDHGEQRHQELHMDILEISGVSILISVMLPMYYTFATYLPGKSVEEMTAAVSGLLRTIQSKQFVITKIVVDPEGGLAALKDTLPVGVNVNAPGTHVPRTERRIRVVKERMRTIVNALPFRMARRFVQYLAFFIASRLGLIPRITDGSRICPRERFTGQKIVFTKELSLCFGDAVMIYSKPDVPNSMEERCFSAMALYPCNNDQGAWKFYKFSTGAIVSSSKWVKCPMQDVQIQLLNAMADEDGVEIGRGRKPRQRMARVRTAPGQTSLERMIVNPHLPVVAPGVADGTVVTPAVEPVALAAPIVQQDAVTEPVHLSVEDDEDGDVEGPPDEDDDGPPELEESDDESDTEDEPEVSQSPAELGSVWGANGERSSARQAGRAARKAEVYKLTVAQAIEKYGEMAKRATVEEFIQMREKIVLQLLHYADLTPEQRERIIHSSLFLKEKYSETGELERIKARLVASGNEMDRALYSAGSSPTVATEAVAILLAQSAAYNEVRYFVDIGTAFLEAPMEDEEVYMWISKSLVPYLVEAMPEAASFVDNKGRVLVRLLKALYGCIMSSRLWFEHIRDILLRGGYRQNEYDPCVFHKGELGNRCSTSLHVDDLFITASTDALAQELLDLLRASLKEVKVKNGKVNSYLGMRITETDTHLEVDMDGYVQDCVQWAGGSGIVKTPADDNLCKINEVSPLLDKTSRERFHTGTAKLLFVAKRCRPGILTAVNFLCARVASATEEDEHKLDRVIKYLRGTPVQPIKYPKGVHKMDLFAYVDAGYGVHDTGESRSGLVVTLNGTPILCKSMRQRIVTKSSTEAELVALSDGLTDIIWCREFIQSAGFEIPATKIGEDNTAVLTLLEARKFGTARTKHISVRYFFICDRIANGELEMVYVPTKEQLADILSKALVGHQFQVLLPRLHGDNRV